MNASPVFVIAEVGVNHNGDPNLAHRLVDLAAETGADAIKFQTFRADALVRKGTQKAEYQKLSTGSQEGQYEMLRKLELSEEAHLSLARKCRSRGLEFLSTPFDESAADLLERIGVARYKIASGEITNLMLLRHVATKRKPMILSTGMSTLEEVGAALQAVRAAGLNDVQLLHCVSDYPTRLEDVNLRVIETLRARFAVPVGFSDHTQGITAAIASIALGAVIIEKHLTSDRNLPGPDHRASLEPGEFGSMVRGIREVELALGDGKKRLTPGEIATQQVARRSLIARTDLPAGAVVQDSQVTAKRPGTGISPMELDRVVGRRLKRAVAADALLAWDDFA